MNPKISVLIPVYNTAEYLPACLDSVLSQSLQDFEIVAVNDASTDDSPRILAEYAAKDPRIRIVDHRTNRGLLAARLSGIRAASGKYLLFLDSDDCFLPRFLEKLWSLAEKTQAGIVHFPLVVRDRKQSLSSKLLRLAQQRSRPCPRELHGAEVFRKFLVENAYGWSAVQKLYQTEICRRAAEFIPDRFCLMGEDFCFYTVCAFFAKHYVPMRKSGYVYYLDSGISSGQKTSLDKFLVRQSPFQALRNVKDFLLKQNAFDEYREGFEKQEQKLLGEYVLRWMRHLADADRTRAFNAMFRDYDAFPQFRAFRTFFSDKDERLLEMLTGNDPQPVPFPGKPEHPAETPVLQEANISPARWNEWEKLIRKNHYDAVILDPDDDLERLFWDLQAIRSSGAAAICRRKKPYLDTLDSQGVRTWLMEDRVLRQASAIIAPDEASAQWYRQRNCHAGLSPETILPPERCPQTAALMPALEKSELRDAYYRIDPAADGETFVPFFRKLDHLFRKLPAGFRRKLFGSLGRFYNRIRGD